MVLVSSLYQNKPLFPPSKCHPMLQALGAMERSSTASGSLGCGQPCRFPYLLLTKNCSPSWWQRICGDLSGLHGGLSSYATTSQWWLYCLLVPPDTGLMVLLRYLALLAVPHSFSLAALSVPGEANPVADALSRFQFQRFRHLAPQAVPDRTPIPPALVMEL